MKAIALLRENFSVSLTAVRTNRLRTGLTILIIAIGIMSLVGILTAIDAIKGSITTSFNDMGANTFTIQSWGQHFQIMNKRIRKRSYSYISYQQAMAFKERYTIPAAVAVNTWVTGSATVKYGSERTNPNIGVEATNEDYLLAEGLEIDRGRNFMPYDIDNASFVAIIGNDLVTTLFKNKNPIDEQVILAGKRYRVIGTLKPKGSSGFGGSIDRRMIIPVSNARSVFSVPNRSFYMEIMPLNPAQAEAAIEEAEGLFRLIRRLAPYDETDFNIDRSDAIAEMLLDFMRWATLVAAVIGLITLLGAAVGLMNIMLVSVNERTREIGTRKATGARSRTIRQQFLFESIVIGQLGGLLGIVLGILIGNVIAALIDASFVIPWLWMLLGVTLCFLVSIASGLIPAIRAARLDPIEALRHE
ncbi:MAG: ABC transporter permease [Prevotellaceae bacterium]|jgi:putative ABC transport system permease protein|nr:ABC transporter permease [Prevotellaceae bacterium]